MKTIANDLKHSGSQLGIIFKSLERLFDQAIDVKLFTLMELDHDQNIVWRSYSNMPDAYPILGKKSWLRNEWSDIIERQQKTFVANSIEEIAKVFPDSELIRSLGCESCLNLPIFINGKIRGTVNCLHEAGHFTLERVIAAESLKSAGALAFLIAKNIRYRGERDE